MGSYLRAGAHFAFWAFRIGAYSKWVLIQRWAVNRINTANKKAPWSARELEPCQRKNILVSFI